ncbi:MAG TPA: DUF2961 domain-containing protein, partial [Verrucomicrobiae bacterium]|nr:DUF2961 domain-containing protein [Verrucomicrobiae bacterium]
MKIARLGAFVWVVCLACPAQDSQERLGMQQLYRLDRLPLLRHSVKIGSVSSYDRTGGNDDGFSGKYSFVRKDAEGLVIADLKGPGVIYRIWTPTPTDDTVEFFFDGETQPRLQVKFRELFLGRHPCFPTPLVGFGAGGYYSYVPLPFAKSCVVRVRAPKVQFYQINYALYGVDAGITTFSPELSAAYLRERGQAEELLRSAGKDITRFSAPPGSTVQIARTSLLIPPGTTRQIFRSKKGGRIVGLQFSPTESLAGKARDLLLKISFDGDKPAVLCPLGDFFGYAWGEPATRSLLVGTIGATNYCYFPMPFEHDAKIEVVSERNGPVALQAAVAYTTVPRRA